MDKKVHGEVTVFSFTTRVTSKAIIYSISDSHNIAFTYKSNSLYVEVGFDYSSKQTICCTMTWGRMWRINQNRVYVSIACVGWLKKIFYL